MGLGSEKNTRVSLRGCGVTDQVQPVSRAPAGPALPFSAGGSADGAEMNHRPAGTTGATHRRVRAVADTFQGLDGCGCEQGGGPVFPKGVGGVARTLRGNLLPS